MRMVIKGFFYPKIFLTTMDLDDIIAAFQVYHHISDIDSFQNWLREYHNFEDFEAERP